MANLAWGGHTNGRIPTSVLTPIGKGALPGGYQHGLEQYAHPAAAAAWRKLVDEVRARTGVTLRVTEGYRDLALQQRYWRELGAGKAAYPGTSNHGWGRAVDMYGYNAAALRAVRELAPALGWSLATGDRVGEPWHIEYVGPLTVPTITSPEEDDMPRLIRRDGGTPEWSLFHPSFAGTDSKQRGYIATTDVATARGWARTYDTGFGNEKSEPRDVYVEMQAAARITHDAYRRGLPAAGGAVDTKPILDAIGKVPTAAENGKAARDAIVK